MTWTWRAIYLVPLFVVVSCGRTDTKVPAAVVDEALSHQVDVYTDLMKGQEDEFGFIYTDACDALLFSALAHTGDLHGRFYIRAARESDGRWQRRPTRDCYPNHSKSTISRDMLLGVMWYAYSKRDLELAENMWAYGQERSWIMGDGVRSRTQLTPGLVATLAQLIHFLGGRDHGERHLIPHYEAPGVTDFEAHLQVLHILLRQRIYGTIEDTALVRLKEHAKRQPENALFQYATGNTSGAVDLLKRYFPADRLPTSNDHCTRWLFERDYGENWQPCDKNETHAGGEFLFLARLLLNG